MLETILTSALIEQIAIPAAGAFIASEAIGLSRKTKSNSLIQLLFRIAKAVVLEIASEENAQSSIMEANLNPPTPHVEPAEAPVEALEEPAPVVKRKAPAKRKTTTRRRTTATK